MKGTGSRTLAPGNLSAVRERLSMPAPAEFEDHDPWTLRCPPTALAEDLENVHQPLP